MRGPCRRRPLIKFLVSGEHVLPSLDLASSVYSVFKEMMHRELYRRRAVAVQSAANEDARPHHGTAKGSRRCDLCASPARKPGGRGLVLAGRIRQCPAKLLGLGQEMMPTTALEYSDAPVTMRVMISSRL